jgi:hypothetical protein
MSVLFPPQPIFTWWAFIFSTSESACFFDACLFGVVCFVLRSHVFLLTERLRDRAASSPDAPAGTTASTAASCNDCSTGCFVRLVDQSVDWFKFKLGLAPGQRWVVAGCHKQYGTDGHNSKREQWGGGVSSDGSLLLFSCILQAEVRGASIARLKFECWILQAPWWQCSD